MDESQGKIVQLGKYKVQVVRDLCIGAASCLAFAPETFVLDDENKAVIQESSTEAEDMLLLAAQSCPTKAILIQDTETGEMVWPN